MKFPRHRSALAAAVAFAVGGVTAPASAQVASLGKGQAFFVNNGLQIWGCDTGASSFTYSNLTNLNMNGVIWSHGVSNPGLLSAGQKWGKWVDHNGSPSTALNATEQAHYADLLTIQVGDEQQSDLENPNGATKAWFQAAHAGNYFTDKLMYVNSTFIGDTNAYINFVASANPDALCWDAYPFGTTGVFPYNWLGKAQAFRRVGLGNYIGAHNAAPRPYGLYLQTYQGGDGARHVGDLEMRWQQFTAWTLGYTFVDAFTVGGGTSLFNGGSMSSPNQPRYNQFKESARQSKNLGPALTKLISYGYGPDIVLGKNPAGVTNSPPIDWPVFHPSHAPPGQQYLTSVSAQNLGTKNNGHPGDVYVGYFNPLLTSYGDPAGTAYFMVTNALGAYLQDPTLTVNDCIQRITLDFNFGSSGIDSLERLRRSDGTVEEVPLTHLSGSLYRLIFDLEGGTGDLFKFDDGSPFVGIELPTQLFYWDADGVAAGNNTSTGAGLGGNGTWDAGSNRWFNGSANGVWTASKDAVFTGAAGTVTLASPQSVESLQFKSNGFTLTGSTLTMTGSEIKVDPSATATINSTVAGAAGVRKTGSGTLVLAGNNTYTGATIVNAGALRVSADANLGATPGGFTASNIILDGGTLQFGGSFDLSNNRGIELGASGGTIDTQSFSNPTGYNAVAGGFTGNGDLTKKGSGTFFAAATTGGVNTTWKGKLILQQGTWKIVATDGLPYNPPLADGLQAAQLTLDGGTWQIGANVSATNARRGITVASGGTIDTQSFNLTWPGPIAGSNSSAILNKTGSGTLRLNSSGFAATYSGNLNVNAGTLQLDGGTAMGDLAAVNLANTSGVSLSVTGANETIGSLAGGGAVGGNVSLSANLTAGGNNTSTNYAGAISGGGAFTKTGAGTMTLTNANTYSGGTTVSGGVLRVNNSLGSGTGSGSVNVTGGTLGGIGSISGNVVVNGGGHVAPGSSAGTLSALDGMTLATGSVLDYELSNVTTVGGGVNDLLAITGDLTLGSSLTLNLDAYLGDLANGTYKLITYTGGLTGNTSGWSIGSTNASGSHGYSFSSATLGEILLIVNNSAPTWNGSASTIWGTAGNWSTAAEPTGSVDVTFPTPVPGTGGTINLASGEAARSLTFNDNYTLAGGNLTVSTGAINVAASKSVTISSQLVGSAALNKSGPGTLVLGGANSYAGGTNMNAGIVRVSSDGNLGAAGGAVTFGGGALNTTSSFASARAVAVNGGGGTIDTNSGVATTLTGAISGAAGNTLTKAGAGTLVLNQPTPRSGASSTWLGNVTVSAGTLKVGNGGFDGFLPGYDPIAYAGLPPTVPAISLAGGTTLEFNHGVGGAGQYATHAVVISGAGNVVIAGGKTETFVANNTYTGTTTINPASSLRIGWGGASNVGGLGATAVANSGTLNFSNDHNTTFPGSVSGTGSMVKEYGGTLTVTGSLSHTGGTNIAAGTLQVGDGGTTGSISGNVTNNAALVFNRSNSATNSAVISGGGSVSQIGSGALALSGANSYTGGTSVRNGILQVSSDGNLGAAPGATATNITLDDGGTLQFGASFDIANTRGIALGSGGGTIDTQGFSNPAGYNATNGGFTGAGNLTKMGSGVFFAAATTGGLNTTWTGKLIIKEGTWKIVASDGLPYNVPASDGLQAEQVTLDGGAWEIGATINVTNGRRGITVASGGGTIDTQNFNLTWAGPIAGSVASATLNKTGSGILRFTGASGVPSTYNGNVNVNAGTLRLDNGNTMGDLASINLANAAGVTLNVTGNETIGSLSGGGAAGGNVTLSAITLTTGGNGKSTTFSGVISGAGGVTKTGSGTMMLSGTNTYTGGTTVNAGKLIVNRLHENNPVTITGGTLQIADSFPTLPNHPAGNDAFVSRPGSMITIDNNGAPLLSRVYNGTLDLGNNDLVVDYSATSPIADVEDMIRAGRNGGAWNGKGIISSTAGSFAAAGAFTLGVIDNATVGITPFTTFSDQTVDTTTVLVKFVHRSDLTMDGVVDFSDSVRFNGNYAEGVPTRWVFGDLNYNGVSDFGDSVLFNGGYDEALASLPEPGALSAVGLLAMGLAGRRRKQGRPKASCPIESRR